MSRSRQAYLAERIRSIASAQAGRLPTVRVLCRTLGTSPVTVTRVLRALVEEGALETVEGRDGYYTPGGAAAPRPVDSVPRAIGGVERVKAHIRGRVLCGDLESGASVGSRLEYQQRLGCTHATVSRALAGLVDEGLLRQRGRSFAVALGPRGKFRRSRVYVVGPESLFRSYHRHIFSMVLRMEHEALDIGWEEISFLLSDSRHPPALPQEHRAAGFVVVLTAGEIDRCARLVSCYPNAPLVTLSLSGDSPPEALAGRDKLFHLAVDNRYAGRCLGRALADHRHCAFFSHLDVGEPWLRERFAGVAEVFGTAGRSITFRGRTRTRPRGSERYGPVDAAHRELRRRLSGLGTLPPISLGDAMAGVYDLISLDEIFLMLEARFEEVFATGEVDLWVCMNDDTAAAAIHFLRSRGVKVPGKIAVAGFDNTGLSHAMGITTYDFGFDRMGTMAVRCLAYPHLVRRGPDGVVPVRGKVIVRDSAGRGSLKPGGPKATTRAREAP